MYFTALCFGIPTVSVLRPEGMVQISENRSSSQVEGQTLLVWMKRSAVPVVAIPVEHALLTMRYHTLLDERNTAGSP